MSIVYYCKEISPDSLVRIYDAVGKDLPKPIACKVHSGEKGCVQHLKPDYVEKLVNKLNGTICECNAAYAGGRDTNEHHWETMKDHGWIDTFGKERVDIMDEEGEDEIAIPDGFKIKKNYVGSHMKNYQSMVVLARFKGHDFGGFGKLIIFN